MSRPQSRRFAGRCLAPADGPARPQGAHWRRHLLLARLREQAMRTPGRPRHAHRGWAASARVIRGGRH